MKWNLVSNGLPKRKKQMYLFAQWNELNQCFIQEYIGTLEDVKINRAYQLKNNFTHYQPLPKPPKSNAVL